jgi:hypothetical protein
VAKHKSNFRFATAAEMRKAVRARYGSSSAVFDEVGNGTGSNCRRHADMVAMGLWPSRGLFLEGIEIKVSRSDWLSELRAPEKADAVGKFCDFWWLAIGDPSIVHEGELPANWGLLVLDGEKLKLAKQATKLEAAPLDRTFVAALLRRAAEAQDRIRQDALSEGREKGLADAPKNAERDRTSAEDDLATLRESVNAFERKSGLKIDEWNGGRLGDVVAKIQALRYAADPTDTLEMAASQCEMFAKQLRVSKQRLAQEMRLVADEAPMVEAANG